MHEPTYREAFSHSWKLLWHNKILWIYGLLAIFIGQFGLSGFAGQLLAGQNTAYTWSGVTRAVWDELAQAGWKSNAGVLWVAVVVLLLVILMVFMGVTAEGALVAAAAEYYHYRHMPDVAGSWHEGVRNFWKIFIISVAQKLLLALIAWVVFLSWDWLAVSSGFLPYLVAMATTAVGLLVGLAIGVIGIFAVGYVVVEEEPVGGALARGAALFGAHLLVSLEVSLLLLLFTVILVTLVSAGFALWVVLFALFSLVGMATGLVSIVAFGWAVSTAFFILCVVLLGAFFNAFTITSWVYLFMKMHREGVVSRIIHYITRRLA